MKNMNCEEKLGISIIITCCNNYKFVKENIEAIHKLKLIHKYEIIVVDDSTEIKEHELDNCEIIYVRNKKNMGVQYSRNKGLENANYKYILMLDGDDMLDTADKYQGENSYIDKSIDILEKNNNIAFTQCISNMFGNFEGYTISSYKITEKLAVHKHHIPLFIIYRRIDGIKCGGYNTKIQKWQDWSFGVYIMNYRYKTNQKNEIYFFDKPYHRYRVYNSENRISYKQISEFEMTKITIKDNMQLFKKYYKDEDINTLAGMVVKNKPDRLEELVYVANCDINIAMQIIEQRRYSLTTDLNIRNVP